MAVFPISVRLIIANLLRFSGKATLLLGKKLKHFEELLDQAENKTALKDISINDLLGYWELMENQINEVKSLFENLEQFKNRNAITVNAVDKYCYNLA